MSVVTEPERSKLIIPEKEEERESFESNPRGENNQRRESEPKREADFATVINTTFDSLKTTLVKQLPAGAGMSVVYV